MIKGLMYPEINLERKENIYRSLILWCRYNTIRPVMLATLFNEFLSEMIWANTFR